MTLRFLLTIFAFGAGSAAGVTCESVLHLDAPGKTITTAETVRPGALRFPNVAPDVLQSLPAFCRVAATLTTSSDSRIKIEVWLPADFWNGKFLAVGNSGWGGFLEYRRMAEALREHYATASTDTGHEGDGGSFALMHPEKLMDYAYRAVHEMAVTAKVVVSAFYGKGPRLSYFVGCSTGGRQALMEAQRYPEDFDGIIAGAPANNRNHQNVSRMARLVAIARGNAEPLPPTKAELLNNSVLGACDALDGVKDGLLEDPRRCQFDPSTLLCRDAATDGCLTRAQLAMARMAYAPDKTSKGQVVFPGWQPGSEFYWPSPDSAEPDRLVLDNFRYIAHEDPKWDWRSFDLYSDLELLLKKGELMDATSPDLREFRNHGGKLLIYHGWSDASIAPGNSIDYYSSVLKKMGPGQDGWLRLFMVPGMAHCGGGPGPNEFRIAMLSALERWRERGIAPDRIVAAHVTANGIDMTRPLCPYPQVARWNGVGSSNDADNFVCRSNSSVDTSIRLQRHRDRFISAIAASPEFRSRFRPRREAP